MRITKRFRFEAAHQLPWHHGKCSRPHGHSYILDVTLSGPINPDATKHSDAGMVRDFADISDAVDPIISVYLDHHNLNDLMENPTAENIVARFIAPRLQTAFGDDLVGIRLYETATAWVDWTPDENH